MAALTTKAVKEGGDWVINGQKMWITNGLQEGLLTTVINELRTKFISEEAA